MGFLEACRSKPQHPFFCVHVPVCLVCLLLLCLHGRHSACPDTLRHLAMMYVNKPTTDDPDGESD